MKPDPISAKLCPLTRVKWRIFGHFPLLSKNTYQSNLEAMLGKNLMLSQKTSTVLMMYSIFNISTSSQFRTVPYGWCGPSEHAVVSVVVAENGNGHYSVILAIIQLFSPLCQLFSPCVFVQCSIILSLCFVQSAVYILSRPSVPGKVNFLNLLEHIIISKANDSVEFKPNKK